MSSQAENVGTPTRRRYVPAIGPRLKWLLNLVLFLVALLGANSLYLLSLTILEWLQNQTYQNSFSLWMLLAHVCLGLVLIVPFVVFGTWHMLTARKRKNKRAIRVGYVLLIVSLLVLLTGVFLIRIGDLELRDPGQRQLVYWLHVVSPLFAGWLYWLHRLAGQKIRWRWGLLYGSVVAAGVGAMVVLHSSDPRDWNQVGSDEGVAYFEPSLARTSDGGFIPARVLDNDQYCLSCHADAYEGWFHSAHHFSSFNNPAYLATIRETRRVFEARDGHVKASRWCAGCHDPVPFFSGAFDDPDFDDRHHPTAQAGITCTACHAITHVNSSRGNADYTIEEPLHYPFAFSKNPILKQINHQLIKARPEFHKKTFLKDFHRSAEFCSTCHKVHLPKEVTGYKEFLRGQNHYDSWLVSGVSGHGAQSFYYPEKAITNCSGCHMPPQVSTDFGARQLLDNDDRLMIHNHGFAAGNTGLPHLTGRADQAIRNHRNFLAGTMRVDIFGIKSGGEIDGELHAPLRPQLPVLQPGKSYLLETVIRTLKLGHHFTQGTADSNEIWLDVTLKCGDQIIGRSGGMDENGEVDRWSHFVNVFMLDKDGNRINRRNAQDIFTPLYNHQIPPGAAQVVHYGFTLPEEVAGHNITQPLQIDVKLKYRKFDQEYLNFIRKNADDVTAEKLPVITLAEDSITLPIAGVRQPNTKVSSEIPEWERWNDYGIGLFLEGKAELRQAEAAFRKVEELGRYDGPLNLARVYYREGRVDEAGAAISRAAKMTDPSSPEWTLAWLSGLVNREQQELENAEQNFRKILEGRSAEQIRRGFDFSRDYRIRNLLGLTLFDRAQEYRTESQASERKRLLSLAAAEFEKTLLDDSENVTAHYNLAQIYKQLSQTEKATQHQTWHQKYKQDDTAKSRAVRLARVKYPAANHAAEALVIYPLQRPDAPELPVEIRQLFSRERITP